MRIAHLHTDLFGLICIFLDFIQEYFPEVSSMVETSSKLKVWWLQRFKGYAVKSVTRRPRTAPFGRIVYESTYRLVRE